jgi:hypothetical protein
MVPALTAAVILVGVVALLDLILTVGVIRRLREHTALLSNPPGAGGPRFMEVGQEIEAFATVTIDGQPLGRDTFSGETLIGFFTPQCQPCKAQLPSFVDYARSTPGGPTRVLAAVIGEDDEVADMVTTLRPVAQVVVESRGGPLVTAFHIRAFPTVAKVAPDGGGRVIVVDNQVELGTPTALTIA